MSDLVTWLADQLDEDERIAQAAAMYGTDEWDTSSDGDVNMAGTGSSGPLAVGPWGGSLWEAGVHMARWDPARVLAEIAAKRRILNLGPGDGGYADAWGDAVCALALPYAGRPGYRDEWRPA